MLGKPHGAVVGRPVLAAVAVAAAAGTVRCWVWAATHPPTQGGEEQGAVRIRTPQGSKWGVIQGKAHRYVQCGSGRS